MQGQSPPAFLGLHTVKSAYPKMKKTESERRRDFVFVAYKQTNKNQAFFFPPLRDFGVFTLPLPLPTSDISLNVVAS